MADTSWMARVGARLVTNGYAILPIAPGTKKPGQFARAGWHDYPQWNRHASRATTEFEVATWSTWPDCGVGIVGGTVAALDIDIAEDGELALHIERDEQGVPLREADGSYVVDEDELRGNANGFLKLLTKGKSLLPTTDYADREVVDAWVEWLDAQPAVRSTEAVRHVRFDEPLGVYIDGRRGRATILKHVVTPEP